MILTYKIKHNQDYSSELVKAKLVANFAITNRDKLSSKYVSQLGLKASVANQLLRKYGRNKKCTKITSVNLIVPGQVIEIEDNTIRLVPLKLILDTSYLPKFTKVNQVELDATYAYISVTVCEKESYQPKSFVGLDRNTNGHVAVCANLSSGRVLKLGKSALHKRNKYKSLRKTCQSKSKFSFLKKISKKESNVLRDMNHKISRKILDWCYESKSGLVLEDLKGIRKGKHSKSFNGTINSWSFYQLQTFLEYKAKLLGVPISYVDPAYTSQMCNRCSKIGLRTKKLFQCECGLIEHADVNAAFNIASKHVQLLKDRDLSNSYTDVAKKDMSSKST